MTKTVFRFFAVECYHFWCKKFYDLFEFLLQNTDTDPRVLFFFEAENVVTYMSMRSRNFHLQTMKFQCWDHRPL